jgi:GTP-binding protein
VSGHRAKIAIVGRPNVGKSTFFNRLVGGRPALVHDTPGLTRDRRYGEFEYEGRTFEVIDTGGLDPEAVGDAVGAGIHRQAHRAMEEADLIIFVVDAEAGPMPDDRDLARKLRKIGRPVLVAANKVDHPKRDALLGELAALGMGEIFPVSAAHGRGIDDLFDRVIEVLALDKAPPEADDLVAALDRGAGEAADGDDDGEPDVAAEAAAAQKPLRIALLGKPNAGKSSLLNRLVGSERSLVHHVAGTTTDPVDEEIEFRGKRYVLVDTAGIRRRSRVEGDAEKLSVSLALGQLERCDVVVLVLDAREGASDQDARLAGLIEARGRALVVALNKADLLTGKSAGAEAREATVESFHFLKWAPMHFISALRGDGVPELLGLVDKVAVEHRKRVTTSELNRFYAEVCEVTPPPAKGGRVVRIHYLTQGRVQPPTFIVWANHPDYVDDGYRRFLQNQLRKRYGFKGTPVRLVIKAKAEGNKPRPKKAKPIVKGRGRAMKKRR